MRCLISTTDTAMLACRRPKRSRQNRPHCDGPFCLPIRLGVSSPPFAPTMAGLRWTSIAVVLSHAFKSSRPGGGMLAIISKIGEELERLALGASILDIQICRLVFGASTVVICGRWLHLVCFHRFGPAKVEGNDRGGIAVSDGQRLRDLNNWKNLNGAVCHYVFVNHPTTVSLSR